MNPMQGVFSWRLLWSAAALLPLSLLAPLAWYGVGQRQQTLRNLADDTPSAAVSRSEKRASNRPTGVMFAAHRQPAAAEPQLAQYAGLVADNIDLDPSITETPALPPRTEPADSSFTTQDEVGPITEPPAAASPEPAAEPELPATLAWPFAAGLIEQANILAATVPQAADWAGRTRQEAEALARLPSLEDPASRVIIGRLNVLADEAKQLAGELPGEDSRSRVLRAGYAVVRRVVLWDQVHRMALRGDVEVAPIIDRAAWDQALAQVDRRLAQTGAAANWRTYLKLDEARARFDSSECTPSDQRHLAREILHRMHSTQLSQDQEQYLKSAAFAALAEQLHSRASQTPDIIGLLAAIERLEHDGMTAEARALADQYDQLRWSADPAVKELAETVNAYYRNANVRVALSAELINRMLPRTKQQYEPVEDTILEARVQGDSFTSSQLRLVLVPDPGRWNIGLEAVGEVASNTASSKGPATFYQNGLSFFRARKRVTVDRRGIRLHTAEAAANANNNLDDFETDFDGIPLLSNLVRAIARNQYEDSQPAAKVEVEGRIVWRATSQLDREVAQKLEQSKRDFQTKLVQPLRKLDLEPTAVDLETTTERLIGRYRVAGRDQVAAHTPRPQAPGDSLLSVQIHETAFNNVLEHLELEGQRIELRELYKQMTDRFSGERVEVPDDLPENVYVTFADEDAVRIDCHDGRVRLTIRLKELLQEGTKNQWRNFTVRAYYAPVADQLDANLEREGAIELIGRDRLGIGDRLALSAIFGKVLNRNRKLNLVNKQIAQAPELRDQQVTQFVIHDGWIGVALGPQAPGRAAAMQPRPTMRTRTE